MYRSGIYRNGTPLTYTEEVYMYRSGPNFEFGEKPVPKWYVPKWSCTELALTRHDKLIHWPHDSDTIELTDEF